MPDPHDRLIYCLDGLDEIVFANAAWNEFATSNGAPDLVSHKVLGKSIWDFISTETIRHVYRHILVRVRAGQTLQFDFRCDSPEQMRLMTMKISPLARNGIQFETETRRIDVREPEALPQLSKRTASTEDLIITCSWCHRLKTGEDTWFEAETAIGKLGLFERDPMPALSHGMCDLCYANAIESVKR